MRPDISHLSQYLDVRNRSWRPRSCGIVALAMVLGYWHRTGVLRRTPPSISVLNRVGHAGGAYIRNVGWSHAGLARLARRFGLDGKNFDWFAFRPAAAFKKLAPLVRRGPVIASVYRNPGRKQGGHLVVVAGIAGRHVHLLDPAAKTRARIPRTLSKRAFLTIWKRRVIVIGPRLRNRQKSVH